MIDEFVAPDFLEDRTFENIMEEMIEDIPGDIDMSEGNHPYNLIAPTAWQEEYFAQYIIVEAIKMIFPKFCEGYDDIVDLHAEINGMTRKEAEYATGSLTVTGEVGTEIPAGTVFSTASINDVPSIGFVSLEDAVIPEEGTVEIRIQAEEAGVIGNVAQNTIILQDSPIDGVLSVTNEETISGGVEGETTESLIERISAYELTQGLSFVGSDSDYKRWAEEVSGTGVATVVPPTDDSGLVTIILTDSAGKPATTELCQSVYNHIMSPDDRQNRLAPVNALLQVLPPTEVNITVSATIEVADEATITSVKSAFLTNVAAYMAEVPEDHEVKYTKIGAILSSTAGVIDYEASTLKVNGGTTNIEIDINEFPQVRAQDVTFTEATEG